MAKPIDIATHTRALTADGSDNLVVTNELQVSTIDTNDSSAITVIPAATFNSDVTVENNLQIKNNVVDASGQTLLPSTLGTANYVLKVNAAGTGAEWLAPGDVAGTVRTEEFPTVANGSANVTMGSAYTLSQIDVYLNGARMRATIDYTVSSTTLTFSENLSTGDIVALYVYDTTENLITGNWSDLNDVSVTGAATNTMVRFDGSNYVAASTTEDSSGNLSLGDNKKINFGAGSDLQIYHNGSNSYIDDQGTGALIVKSNLVSFRNAADTEDLIKLTEDGDVQLYYDNTLLLFTGTDVTTGDYVQVNGDFVSSNGFIKCTPSSGGPALTFNDGGGNSNLVFNHTSMLPDQNGNSARIHVNTDSTTSAALTIGLAENVTAGATAALTTAASFTLTGVTVTGAVTDSVSDVRTPRRTAISTATTIADEGVYYCTSNPTLTLGAPAAGAVMTIYNNSASSMTLNRGSTLTNMRIAADNNVTNNTSVTLGARSTTVVTMFLSTLAVVSGTDVS